MLELIKKVLGITNNSFDDVIQMYISSAKRDLESIGVIKDETDPLYKAAVVMYVRGNFDEENFDKYIAAYELQKDYMRKTKEYVS